MWGIFEQRPIPLQGRDLTAFLVVDLRWRPAEAWSERLDADLIDVDLTQEGAFDIARELRAAKEAASRSCPARPGRA